MTTWAKEPTKSGLQESSDRVNSSPQTYLQVRSDKRPASCVVKVAFHEEVEKMGGIAPDRAQLGVTALEDFIAQGGTHVGSSVKEGTGELEGTWEETGCRA